MKNKRNKIILSFLVFFVLLIGTSTPALLNNQTMLDIENQQFSLKNVSFEDSTATAYYQPDYSAINEFSTWVDSSSLSELGKEAVAAAATLQQTYQGTQIVRDESHIIRIFGKPMTRAADASEAADIFIDKYAAVFGVADLDLQLNEKITMNNNRFTVFHYIQHMENLPVEYSHARILFNNDIGSVVYASCLLAVEPSEGLADITIQAEQALNSVKDKSEYGWLSLWSEPELVVFFGEFDRIDPVRVWKFYGDNQILEDRVKYTFYVDAATADLVHVRDDILMNYDIHGSVSGMATPGTPPDMPANPPVLFGIPQILVSVTGGNSVYADLDGFFIIPHGGSSPVTVSTSLQNGMWVTIVNQAGSVLSLSQGVTPPGPVDFMFNANPTEYSTSQVNAFIGTTDIHNYITDRSDWTGVDHVLPARVNINNYCNAYYDYSSINFYREGGGCFNTAYSTVIAHEYGHHIVSCLGLAQGAFGEGYADTVAMFLYDTAIVGEHFYTNGNYIRYPYNSGVTYPCSGGVHYCGQILGGFWWAARLNFAQKYDWEIGLEKVSQLQVDWSLITSGGVGDNSAHPGTVIEVLVADDDDGDLGNGTPHYPEICMAFDYVELQCPELDLISFEFPDGRPDIIPPGQPSTLRFNVVPLSVNPISGTGELHYSIDGGGFIAASIIETSPNEYSATFPAVDCLSQVDYYVQAVATGGMIVYNPKDAPVETYNVIAATEMIVDFDDFETDHGWISGAPDDDATTGHWVRDNPYGTSSSGKQAQPSSPFTGSYCWITGQHTAGQSAGYNDVDNGKTTLLSPLFDLEEQQAATMSYWRWYSNWAGANPYNDIFVVDISNDGGQTWVNVEVVGPTGPQVEGGWYFHEFRVEDFVSLTGEVQIRFVASDYDPQALIEAAVDAFSLITYRCFTQIPGDINGDGCVDLQDLGLLLSAYGSTPDDPNWNPDADINSDEKVDISDLGILLANWGQGCT